MGTGQPNGHETTIAELLPPAAAGHAGACGPAADAPSPQGSLSHPLGTVQTMETQQPDRHGTAITALLPRAAGATADSPAAGGGVPGVVFVGASDVSGRVAVLVDALVGELGGLPAVGAGRDLLRSQVAALGRLRAAADAAEARVVAAVDALGDGGVDAVEVLRRCTGSSQREAQRRKRRADALAGMPNVAGALAAGDISTEHAEALARAAEATSAGAVDGDAGLLAEVAAVPADRAGRRIQEWTQRHQDPDDLHEQHLRQRRRRRLSFGDGDDGMLVANAAFDRVQGAQFRSLINGIADRIWRSEGGRDNPHNTSAAQRRLDALAIAVGLQPPPAPATTARTAARTGNANPALREPHAPEPEPAATAGTGHADPALRNPVGPEPEPPATAPKTERGPRNEPAPPTPDRQPSQSGLQPTAGPPAGPTEPRSGAQSEHRRGKPAARTPQHPRTARDEDAASNENVASAASDNPVDGPVASRTRTDRRMRTAPSARPPTPDCQPVSPQLEPPPSVSPRLEPPAAPGAPSAAPNGQFESPRHQVVIVASADVVSGRDPHGRCEIPGVGPIPQSELERLACDAELFGLLFSGKGEPLWHGRAKRTVTDAQRRALIARDGGCVLCAEEPARCEAHHITPWAKPGNGPTDIDNLALLCGACHRRLHNHKRVLTRNPDGTWATAPDPHHHHHHHTSSAPGAPTGGTPPPDPNAPNPASNLPTGRALTDRSAPHPRPIPGDATTEKQP